MGLVKIDEYYDVVAETAMEALELVGIVHKLNVNGYHISIYGVQDKNTPDGMLDDMPMKHSINIEKHKFVCETHKEFSEKDKAEILNQFKSMDLDIKVDNANIIRDITVDNNGYCWYKHSITFYSSRLALESPKHYVNQLFKLVADSVIKAFEEEVNN